MVERNSTNSWIKKKSEWRDWQINEGREWEERQRCWRLEENEGFSDCYEPGIRGRE